MEQDCKMIGKRIKLARLRADMPQEVLADLVEISASHMSNIETGKRNVRLKVIICIANALAVSMDDLLWDNIIKTKVQFEKDMAEFVGDCDDCEI